MGERTRVLVRLAASLTVEESVQVEAMDAAVEHALEVEEVLLQSHLFLGYPAALNSLGLWRRRTGRPAPAPSDEGPALWEARGVEVCQAVYRRQYEALREVMDGIHPDLDRWAVTDGYGKVLGRPALDLKTRELCIGAQLAGTTASRQLHAHLRGCLNVGATVAEVDSALAAVADIIGADRARSADRVWQKVRDRWESEHGS